MHLVTGGCGEVGSHVAALLLARGERVALFDRRDDRATLARLAGADAAESVTMVTSDLADTAAFREIVARLAPRTIVHLASLMPPVVEEDAAVALHQVTGAMVGVLEAARHARTARLVFASATSVFGRPERHGGPDVAVADDAPHYPESLYGITKSANERLARLYRERHGLDVIGLRFCQGYGPGKQRGRPFGSRMFHDALAGRATSIPYADDIVNFQYTGDIADAVVRAMDAPYRGVDVYNTTGIVVTMREAMALLARLAPASGFAPNFEPGTAGIVWRYDARAAARDLDLPPPTPIEDGFAKTLAMIEAWADR
ncbi:NAD-dependent epimerase/dehydratase family protein [Acuticoccus kandeliae]|uniref:NAD-dependent epimerase/dehydratase family protein n=1 Tax=Acuticoccus kandeliae TaxID=2073160 RepID=UPI000D3ECC10|nr:NAD(P)-dependent oxidoreductase [Acuticoccus kandeliae]